MVQVFVLQVVDIMRVNVEKVLERDQKLSELDDRAGKLINRYIFSTIYTCTIYILLFKFI